MNMIRVMIADDHSLMRKGLQQILELEDDIRVIGQAKNGKEAVELGLTVAPDIILMDINMPIKNGLQAIKELKERGCPAQIIVLTIHEDREYLLKSIKAGASGYVMKDAESDHLIEAIRDVYNGQTYVQPNITTGLIKEFDEAQKSDMNRKLEYDKYDNLTQREIEVLLLIAEGKNNREIAEELFISDKTVKNHVSNIFKKIDVSDRTQAAVYVLKNQ
ncbi:MAG: response regulator transcription factor [Clostridiales bacterium]|nr:response regulator transcription factor [Clostridiales bacterium]